jgi:hypothetical protein
MDIEEYFEKERGKWIYDAFEAGDEVELTNPDISFPVAVAYEDVVFENKENDRTLSE